MNQSENEPLPYWVAYSGLVRTELKALVARAVSAGYGRAALDALKELDARLRTYPQYGEPRRDLSSPGQSEWEAAFPPLFVSYIIDEVNRAVYIVVPLKVLPRAGFQ